MNSTVVKINNEKSCITYKVISYIYIICEFLLKIYYVLVIK